MLEWCTTADVHLLILRLCTEVVIRPTNRLKGYVGLKIQNHGITYVIKRNERFLLLPSDSVSKIRSYFSKNSPSWSGEYCWFFKDYGVKLHISPISLIFGDQLIFLGRLPKVITTAETLHLNKDFIKSLISGKRPRKTLAGENGNHVSKMGWEDVKLFKCYVNLYVHLPGDQICHLNKALSPVRPGLAKQTIPLGIIWHFPSL